jgi:hypothetical protein
LKAWINRASITGTIYTLATHRINSINKNTLACVISTILRANFVFCKKAFITEFVSVKALFTVHRTRWTPLFVFFWIPSLWNSEITLLIGAFIRVIEARFILSSKRIKKVYFFVTRATVSRLKVVLASCNQIIGS